MQVEVLNISGKKTAKKVELADVIYGVEPSDHSIYLDVKHYLAAQRQGTHKSKERAEISRTTKKLKKQKGTGGARAGSMKSPLFIGGGRAFGPRPRDYSFKLNKKTKVVARASALTYKAKENAITVLEDFTFEAPKTKNYVDLMKNLNLQGAKVVKASDLNTYDIVNAETLILLESSVKVLESLLNK